MGIFDSSSSKSTCPSIITGPQYGADNIVGSLNFHKLTTILCGAFTAVTLLLSGIQLLLHATHFSNRGQQTQILRIIALPPTFALVYLLAGSIPSAAIYLQPWADAYEAVALTSYFLLLVTYSVPNPRSRDEFFEQLPQPHRSGEGSLEWYHRTWFFAFQYIPVSIIVAIATDITQAAGKYCINGHGIHFAHLWLTIIRTVSVILAFLRLLQFYRRLQHLLTPHSVIPKLIAIKGVVFLSTLQSIIFTVLTSTGAVKPSSKLSYDDFYFGVPAILICGEMVIFSLFNFYAYNLTPYLLPSRGAGDRKGQMLVREGCYQGGPVGVTALLEALNPTDIVHGLVLAVRYLFSSSQSQSQRYDNLSLRQGGDIAYVSAAYPSAAYPSAAYMPHDG